MEIDVNGVRCHYQDEGAGPVVILLHGFASQVYTWRHTIPALGKDFRVVAVDLPGYGASGKPAGFEYDLPGFAKWLCAFMDAIGAPRAALIGNSMGGGVAYTLATSSPERVTHLVLVDAVGYQPRRERFFLFRLMAMRGIGELLMATMTRFSVRLILRMFVYRDSAHVSEEVVTNYLAPLQTSGGRDAALRTIRRVSFNAAPGPDPCRAPTLILWGAKDRIVPPAHASLFLRDIPGAKHHLFDDCGHFPQEERAAAFNQRVAPFLRQSASGPRALDAEGRYSGVHHEGL